MRKINSILITIVITSVLLIIEIILIKGATKYEPKTSIIYANVDIPEGIIVEANMLEERSVNSNAVSRQSIKNMDDIVGKRARIEIDQGEMILDSKLINADQIEDIKVLDKESRLFSVEFKPDQVNGWWIKEGQFVDIIFIPHDESRSSPQKRINNIRVAALIDDNGNFIETIERKSIPRYISFEVKEGLDEFLAYAKGNGRLEVSVIPYKNTK